MENDQTEPKEVDWSGLGQTMSEHDQQELERLLAIADEQAKTEGRISPELRQIRFAASAELTLRAFRKNARRLTDADVSELQRLNQRAIEQCKLDDQIPVEILLIKMQATA